MYRFCALIPKDSESTQAQAIIKEYSKRLRGSLGYSLAQRSPLFEVYHRPHPRSRLQDCPLSTGNGVIMGQIFRRDGTQMLAELNHQNSIDLINSSGDQLFTHYWGRYVAFLDTADGVAIIVDPIGGLDCYIYEDDYLYCAFSHGRDFIKLGLGSPTINWQTLALHLLNPSAEGGSALDTIDMLHPGSRFTINRAASHQQQLWTMSRIAEQSPIYSISVAAETIFDALLQSTTAWANTYDHLLLLLSGGIDSNVVLGCLKGNVSPSKITCVNFYSDSPEADERHYARLAASQAGVRLVEKKDVSDDVDLSVVTEYEFSPQPTICLEEAIRSKVKFEVASSFGADAMMAGHNGDGIFGHGLGILGAIDYLWLHGIGPGWLHAAYDTARISQCSIWKSLYRSIIMRRKDNISIAQIPTESAYDNRFSSLFPLTPMQPGLHFTANVGNISPSIAPGKLQHFSMMGATGRHWRPCNPDYYLEMAHPTTTQPVIEAACRIAPFLLSYGGRSRGLIRHAFRDRVPSQIICRQSKGGINNYVDEIFQKNLSFLRSYFLDGILAKQGLINRYEVEPLFHSATRQNNLEKTMLLRAISAEAWARYWTAFSPLVAD